LRGNAKIFAREDECFFNESYEINRAEMRAALARKIAAEIEDGIADELAGAVVSNISATFGFVNFYFFTRELGIRCQDVGA